ncbi:MAG: GGDEF domain-containing protein [Myxococcales bacterium]|nr:GGDEF domain-containing protein [Myxococcales bacterium]
MEPLPQADREARELQHHADHTTARLRWPTPLGPALGIGCASAASVALALSSIYGAALGLREFATSAAVGVATACWTGFAQHRALAERIRLALDNERLRDRNEELEASNEVLEQLSITDGLTKLHNHRFFQEQLERDIKRAKRTGEPLAMLICDIDDFKALNDRQGHKAGDELLTGLALKLSDCVRESDLLARYGGEEFVVLAARTDLEGGIHLAEKIRSAVETERFFLDGSDNPTSVTISVGVAAFHQDRASFFRAADQALYRAKASGKNCVMADGL